MAFGAGRGEQQAGSPFAGTGWEPVLQTALPLELLKKAKKFGFSDKQLAYLTKTKEAEIRTHRQGLGIIPVYRAVDTCAAEFEAFTPYYYSTYTTKTKRVRRKPARS